MLMMKLKQFYCRGECYSAPSTASGVPDWHSGGEGWGSSLQPAILCQEFCNCPKVWASAPPGVNPVLLEASSNFPAEGPARFWPTGPAISHWPPDRETGEVWDKRGLVARSKDGAWTQEADYISRNALTLWRMHWGSWAAGGLLRVHEELLSEVDFNSSQHGGLSYKCE